MAHNTFASTFASSDPGVSRAWLIAVCVAVGVSAGCPAGKSTPVDNPQLGTGDAVDTPTEVEPPPPPIRTQGKVIVHTGEGPITLTFFPDIAPRTVAHVLDLMAAGCYEGVDFFRLEPNFVTQVSPVSRADCHPDAMATVPAEFSDVKHERLALSLARWDDPDSGTSSWSIVLGPVPSMDGQYTVFGRVVDGEDTIRKIEAIGSTRSEDGMRRLDRKVLIDRVEIVEPISDAGSDSGADPGSGSDPGSDSSPR